MRRSTLTVSGTLLAGLALAAVAAGGPAAAQSPRAARPLPAGEDAAKGFDPGQSAGLFIGIRRFPHDRKLAEVPYAVDDAVDLAFTMALDLNVRLVEPGRVALALSGEPQKPESQQHLDALKAAGATVHPADQADILDLLDNQARAVGRRGILIISLATHGFSEQGDHYLLTASSLLRHRETSISANKIFDLAAQSEAPRSLILLDACRERLTSDSRQVEPDPRSAASQALLSAIARSQGQVALFAAPLGGYAYDDDTRQNGVFTAAVIESLRCAAPTDQRGFVTVDTLATHVNRLVEEWRRKHGYPPGQGIAYQFDGGAADLPLAGCSAARTPVSNPAAVRTLDQLYNVFDESGVRLWGGKVDGRIAKAEVADLDGDGRNEVVVGVDAGGEDTGKVMAFGATGNLLWSADTTAEPGYQGGHSGRMAVRTFATGDLFRRGTRQVVVLAIDSQAWYQSRLFLFDSGGRQISSYWHPGHLRHLAIGAPTPQDMPKIVVAALNNDLRSVFNVKENLASVFLLDPRDIRGEAPPYFGGHGRGSQLWYGVVLPPGQEIERLEILDRNQDKVNDISVWTSSRTVFYLGFDGRVLATARADGAEGESSFSLLIERNR